MGLEVDSILEFADGEYVTVEMKLYMCIIVVKCLAVIKDK